MVQVSYVSLSLLMSIVLLLGYNYGQQKVGASKKLRTRRTALAGLGLFAWFFYLYLITRGTFLQDYSLPPRFPLLLVLPAFLFIAIILYRQRKSRVFYAIPKSWTTFYQSFRILIELLFVASVSVELLHREVTFEGYNYDIIFGISAILVTYLVFYKKWFPEKVALYWNYFGLLIIAFIIFLFTSTIYAPELWGKAASLAPPEMLNFPFVLVPAFLMPSAVFIHVFAIMQWRKH